MRLPSIETSRTVSRALIVMFFFGSICTPPKNVCRIGGVSDGGGPSPKYTGIAKPTSPYMAPNTVCGSSIRANILPLFRRTTQQGNSLLLEFLPSRLNLISFVITTLIGFNHGFVFLILRHAFLASFAFGHHSTHKFVKERNRKCGVAVRRAVYHSFLDEPGPKRCHRLYSHA